MKPSFVLGLKRFFALVLGGLFISLFLSSVPAAVPPFGGGPEYQPAAGEFDFVGKAVVQLLQTKDASGFATNLSVNAQDWRSLITTNLPKAEADRLSGYAKGSSHTVQRLEASARALLDRAESLHLDFSKGDLQCQVVAPKHVGKIYFSNPTDGGLTAPYLDKLEIILNPVAAENQTNQGEFKLLVRGLEKFPDGWRINGSIQWAEFPTNLVDEKTAREMVILEKIAAYKGITAKEDPTLFKLGESLVRFVQTGDTNLFVKEALMNSDQVWDMFQKSGRKDGPSRAEVDEEIAKQTQVQLEFARKMLGLMAEAGMDLRTAEIQIKEASLDRIQSQGPPGTTELLGGELFKLALSVKTDAKAKNGAALSGDYVLGVKRIVKMGGDWKVMGDAHWEHLPAGIVDDKAVAAMEFENYVAKHGTLPIHAAAPDIEFTTLVGDKKMKLSDLRGKVVVLDFWATWCGPCQEPMAELQTLRKGHDDWQDKVAIVPLSIDDTLDIVRKHVDQRGWTNTFNVWAGDGGWQSAPARTFRVTGVPTSYIIDAQGKIVWAGHPAGASFARTIDRLLQH